jgi:hypothetical protein
MLVVLLNILAMVCVKYSCPAEPRQRQEENMQGSFLNV